ncbi:DegT/DnrJ/EryC1/StrS aminotransferase family protein [Pseudonocardia sp. ICBG1034]|uniref:DegT/DnrJ/EryC1/StrS family aminotransferase n=1 Tax=Pseudonocardia sp. ICBG1034 TaxID=2844381 RepID=UPI001CC97F56|nr:DegT/DnrJ/EryC1/StrS family aminotransferase [Pseudonocardia sp. ICBG1034]
MSKEFIPVARPIIGDGERAAVDAVLRSGMLAQGREVGAFEKEFADDLLDGRPVVAVNSGTAGLHLGLLAAGVGPGDEVVVPSFTFAATANAVALTGATPVFADIRADDYCLDPAHVESLVTGRTKGVLAVHLYGQPADMTALSDVAARHGHDVYEDAAQAHGAAIGEQRVGTFGAFAMFSLYPTKNMTSGEGGMVSTGDEDLARRVRLLRNQGMERQYENEVVGFNARMTDLHAAIGRVQLVDLPGRTEARRDNARFFDEHLVGVGTPVVRPGVRHVYHQYTITVPDDRDGFVAALRDEYGVGSGVYYPTPVHRLLSFGRSDTLPVTDRVCRTVLSLPVHPSLDAEDRDRVVTAVNALAKAGA